MGFKSYQHHKGQLKLRSQAELDSVNKGLDKIAEELANKNKLGMVREEEGLTDDTYSIRSELQTPLSRKL